MNKLLNKKKVSPNKRFYGETFMGGLKVVSRDAEENVYSLALFKYELPAPLIFKWSADSQAIGMLFGITGGYFICLWLPFRKEFYKALLTTADEIDEIEVLPDEHSIICFSDGKEIEKVKLPNAEMLTPWQKQKQVLENEPAQSPKTEWTWNETKDGYEGVHLREGVVLWFEHCHNPHTGGAASSQSFEEFLEDGPCCAMPHEFINELYQSVKILATRQNS